MNFVETIYNDILLMRKKKFSLNDVAKATGLQYGFDKRTLAKTLDNLARQGKLEKLRSENFDAYVNKISTKIDMYTEKLDVSPCCPPYILPNSTVPMIFRGEKKK